LDQAYDADRFRTRGHQLIDALADRLSAMTAGSNEHVLNWITPEKAISEVQNWPDGMSVFESLLDRCISLHDPRFMGHQIMPPLPVSSLAGLVSDFSNNGMGVFEMGIGGTTVEHLIIKEVAARIGFDGNAGGFLTSGGSLANLTAMLAARSRKCPDVWQEGSQQKLALMVSDQSHYCVDRAARIMGWGAEGVIKIQSDSRFRMRTETLERELEAARRKGIQVIAVVGSACTTSTGSYDDLQEIGRFCRQHDLWFHVDGAHGAAAVFSAKYKSLVKGIELADSVTLDFHKMLMAPAITSALVFRDGRTAYGSFAQQADYLWSDSSEEEWYNLAKRTFECTKTMMCLKVYSIVAMHGWEIFDENVTRLNDRAREFAEMISVSEDFELAVEPETNIVCFRYKGTDSGDSSPGSSLNASVRKSLIEEGEYYIVQTTLSGRTWLRTTVANPFTTETHFRGLLDKIRQHVISAISS
ncbi:MAG: pyridoxal-dependent decarboxylase, partial [Planctomycetota bacterium]